MKKLFSVFAFLFLFLPEFGYALTYDFDAEEDINRAYQYRHRGTYRGRTATRVRKGDTPTTSSDYYSYRRSSASNLKGRSNYTGVRSRTDETGIQKGGITLERVKNRRGTRPGVTWTRQGSSTLRSNIRKDNEPVDTGIEAESSSRIQYNRVPLDDVYNRRSRWKTYRD